MNSVDPAGGAATPAASGRDLLLRPFAALPDLIRVHAAARPAHIALRLQDACLSYAELSVLVDRTAVGLQRCGLQAGAVAAFCANGSFEYVAAFLGCLRAGLVPAPLPLTAAPADLSVMLNDSGARLIFLDRAAAARFPQASAQLQRVWLDGSAEPSLREWLGPQGVQPAVVQIVPDSPFNIIYSSGTTGTPKGIVQSHRMRWAHVKRAAGMLGYGESSVAMVPTPPYSNLTLVNLLPTLACGATAVLMSKFDADGFLQIAERVRATHAMLVPVQYRRILDAAEFERFDLSSFVMKVCAGAPCSPELKAEVLRRWPGAFVDLFGMTEGGGTSLLFAREHPDKLHTVGRPQPGHDIRIVRDDGSEAQAGEMGEVAGRSDSMMLGYHNLPAKTQEAYWHDRDGTRFIRTGDIGVFDEDGFLVLKDRKKDMIISGGFNIYPSDLEAVLRRHEAVAEAAVVGAPSRQWGETPVAFVTLQGGASAAAEEIRAWANAHLGKTQRIAALEIIDAFPRSGIDKILKAALRERAIAALRDRQAFA
jgi:acyl-CoA synthetase (AMP-forming)/AMP-acid ligase II